jgi:hypothetical protein
MTLIRLANHIFDLDQLQSKESQPEKVVLYFRNGERLELPFRDALEKKQIMAELEPVPKSS